MKDRILTFGALEDVVAEKAALYKEWLDRGIIKLAEYEDRLSAINSVLSLAFFHTNKAPSEMPKKEIA